MRRPVAGSSRRSKLPAGTIHVSAAASAMPASSRISGWGSFTGRKCTARDGNPRLSSSSPVVDDLQNGPQNDRTRTRLSRMNNAKTANMTKVAKGAIAISMLVGLATLRIGAVTRTNSADGQYWDVQDTSPWSQDSGGIATGGRAMPFNGFGYLKLQVRRADSTLLVRNQYLTGFGLSPDGAGRFDSIRPIVRGDVVVARALFAPPDADYLRYFDSFTNAAAGDRVVEVAWGGAVGAYDEGGLAAVATTSSGDRQIDPGDTFATLMQNARRVADPMHGPSGHGPSAHVLGTARGVLTRIGDMYGDPFVDRYPGFDPAHVAYVFRLALKPGQTKALVTFVAKGLSELYDASKGSVRIRDGVVPE